MTANTISSMSSFSLLPIELFESVVFERLLAPSLLTSSVAVDTGAFAGEGVNWISDTAFALLLAVSPAECVTGPPGRFLPAAGYM